jgi:hypothetical protein
MRQFLISVMMGAGATLPAHAHVGHVGELAGHAHWIGVGAAIAAGAIAIAIAKGMRKPDPKAIDGDEARDEEVSDGKKA